MAEVTACQTKPLKCISQRKGGNKMSVFKGLEKLAEFSLSDESYSFDVVGVWRDEEGLYIGTDSGCSCPMPWESHTRDDLTGPMHYEHVAQEVVNLWKTTYNQVSRESIREGLRKVANRLTDDLDFTINSEQVRSSRATKIQYESGVVFTQLEDYAGWFDEDGNRVDEYDLPEGRYEILEEQPWA